MAASDLPAQRGLSGRTHCGSWRSVAPNNEFGWVTRIVCTLPPMHDLPHRHHTGSTWTSEWTRFPGERSPE